MSKDVGMACQKVCKQDRDDAWKQRLHIGEAPSLHPFHTSKTASLKAESAYIHAVINAVHNYLILHTDYYDHAGRGMMYELLKAAYWQSPIPTSFSH